MLQNIFPQFIDLKLCLEMQWQVTILSSAFFVSFRAALYRNFAISKEKKSANSNHKTRCYVQSVVDQLALVNDHLYSTALSSEILFS